MPFDLVAADALIKKDIGSPSAFYPFFFLFFLNKLRKKKG